MKLFTLGFLILVGGYAMADSHDLEKGRELYMNNCIACHGAKGDGRGPAAVAIKTGSKPRNFLEEKLKYGDSEEAIFQTLTKGIKDSAMPSWAALSESDRRALSKFIHSVVSRHAM